MVRAIIAGTKTQTRRVVKPQPHVERRFIEDGLAITKGDTTTSIHTPLVASLCPYGQPSDRLWVREAWGLAFGSPVIPHPDAVIYRADEGNADWDGRWRPSIHMPRWASRITLEIVSVRVERLQDISEADAKAEGTPKPIQISDDDPRTYRDAFGDLWELINGDGSWDANPWVWVVEFKRVQAC
jgi:hypothetical protein